MPNSYVEEPVFFRTNTKEMNIKSLWGKRCHLKIKLEMTQAGVLIHSKWAHLIWKNAAELLTARQRFLASSGQQQRGCACSVALILDKVKWKRSWLTLMGSSQGDAMVDVQGPGWSGAKQERLSITFKCHRNRMSALWSGDTKDKPQWQINRNRCACVRSYRLLDVPAWCLLT